MVSPPLRGPCSRPFAHFCPTTELAGGRERARNIRRHPLSCFRPWQGAEIWLTSGPTRAAGSTTVSASPATSAERPISSAGTALPHGARLLPPDHRSWRRDRKIDPDLNLLGGTQTANRIVFTIGKLSVVDIFDTNKYIHNPRNDFLNWSILDAGSFDYAADG